MANNELLVVMCQFKTMFYCDLLIELNTGVLRT